jgi:hypothetical protein
MPPHRQIRSRICGCSRADCCIAQPQRLVFLLETAAAVR